MHPETITNDQAGGMLEIVWQDAVHQQIRHARLRAECKCADCKALRQRTGEELAVPDGIRLDDLRPVGAYALQLVFSDGHERGIYPWIYLRALGENSDAAAYKP